MNSLSRTWNWDVCQRNHYVVFYFKANYPRLMKFYLVFKRPQTCTVKCSHILNPLLLGYFLYLLSWMLGKLMTQFHTDTQKHY